MKKFSHIILTLGIVLGFGLSAIPSTVGAIDVFPACTDSGSDSSLCKAGGSNDFVNFIQIVVNTMMYVLGAVAVVTIIIAAVRYVTSQGDPKAVQIAKDTMLYAVIGLVVAIVSYAIVNYVANAIGK